MNVPTPQVPGLDLSANRGPELNVVAIVFICISLTTIICRGFSRVYTEVDFGLDDWLIVLAAVVVLNPPIAAWNWCRQFFSWIFTALGIAAVQFDHLGQHTSKTGISHSENFLKLAYASFIIYPFALTLSKLSLLALYWRIFRMTTGRRPLQVVAMMNIAWMISVVCHQYRSNIWSWHMAGYSGHFPLCTHQWILVVLQTQQMCQLRSHVCCKRSYYSRIWFIRSAAACVFHFANPTISFATDFDQQYLSLRFSVGSLCRNLRMTQHWRYVKGNCHLRYKTMAASCCATFTWARSNL